MRRQNSYYAKKEELNREWVLVDASEKILGRLASQVSMILRGKDSPEFTPSVATGRNVIIINAEKIKVTGNKEQAKMYYRASGYPGGLKEFKYSELMKRNPTEILRRAVAGMLPDNRLKDVFLRSLKIYCGSEHPHQAQNAKIVD